VVSRKGDNPVAKDNSTFLFNAIAPVYGLFYGWQKGRSLQVIDAARDTLDLFDYHSILDVGCGTGALCAVLSDKGFEVTGIDPAEKMLRVAKRKAAGRPVRFLTGNVLDGLPFEDKSFDVAIASYVAHGMGGEERQVLYKEMGRVARHKVVIYDYNQMQSSLTDLVERLEGGDYPNFIENAEAELRQAFSQVEVIQVARQSNWYICTPLNEMD
jgi:ubiquinone/menaquinone biosynthesis C-methylase UbiE